MKDSLVVATDVAFGGGIALDFVHHAGNVYGALKGMENFHIFDEVVCKMSSTMCDGGSAGMEVARFLQKHIGNFGPGACITYAAYLFANMVNIQFFHEKIPNNVMIVFAAGMGIGINAIWEAKTPNTCEFPGDVEVAAIASVVTAALIHLRGINLRETITAFKELAH